MICTTLIDTDALQRHLGEPDWVIFDCRHDLAQPDAGELAYHRAHLPGAQFMHLDRDLAAPLTGNKGRHPLPDAETFARKLASCGADSGKQVVAYDNAGGMVASRLWWMLRWLGHDAVAVLNGGWSKWVAEKRPVSSDLVTPTASRFNARVRAMAVNVDQVLAHVRKKDDTMTIVDARGPDRFRGENETMDPVGGHIPGAINRSFRNNLGADGCFKPDAVLREDFARVIGPRNATDIVHQCGSGVSACHNVLAMEVAGLRGSRLYPGSWSEWCSDPSRPVANGDSG